jgi:hypothetical protein
VVLPPPLLPELDELDGAGAEDDEVDVDDELAAAGALDEDAALLDDDASPLELLESLFFELPYRSEYQPPPLSWKLVRLT